MACAISHARAELSGQEWMLSGCRLADELRAKASQDEMFWLDQLFFIDV
jgi:hypothetical protein